MPTLAVGMSEFQKTTAWPWHLLNYTYLPIALFPVMWQTVFHIPLEIAGMRVFGVGLLLGIWAIFCLGLLAWLAWRQGFNADTLSYLPVMLLVAAVIAWLLPALCDQQGLPIHGFGIMMLLAVVAAMGLAVWRAKRVGLNSDLIYSIALWVIIPGIIAARAFYVIEYWSSQYWPVYQDRGGLAFVGAMLNIAQGGLVVYGGLLAGLLGLLSFARIHKLPLMALADLIAPSMVLGLAFGRIGCLMNGCCFGGECDLPWAITFPAGKPRLLQPGAAGRDVRFYFKQRSPGCAGVACSEVRFNRRSRGIKARRTAAKNRRLEHSYGRRSLRDANERLSARAANENRDTQSAGHGIAGCGIRSAEPAGASHANL